MSTAVRGSLSRAQIAALVVALGLGAFYVVVRIGQSPSPAQASSGAGASGAAGAPGARIDPGARVPVDASFMGPSSKSMLGSGSPGGALREQVSPQTTPGR
jgi:hypothetical protein